jgi:hypothetical protein
VGRFGVWAAWAAAVAAIGYDIPQILQVLGVLKDPWDRILIFAPSLALAPAFVLAVAAAHAAAPPGRKGWSLAALALAILYAADVSMIYVTQLAVVIPQDVAGRGAAVAFAACCAVGSPLRAVDILGYAYMSGATGLLAAAFPGGGRGLQWLRWSLIANAALGPVLLAQLAWPVLIYVASPWVVVFPASMICLARVLSAPEAITEV